MLFLLTLSIIVLLPACAGRQAEMVTAKVRRGDITVLVSTTGEVAPLKKVNLSFKTGGIIKTIAEEGDKGKAGDILAELETESLVLQVEQAQAALETAQGNYRAAQVAYQQALDANHTTIQSADLAYEQAEMSVRQAQKALDDAFRYLDAVKRDPTATRSMKATAINGVHSAKRSLETAQKNQETAYWNSLSQKQAAQAQLDTAAANLKTAQAQLSSAQIALEQAQLALEEAQIKAPFDGTVLATALEEGEYVAPGLTLLTFADISELKVTGTVDETDIPSLKEDQQVDITLDAYPDQTMRGELVEIAPSAEKGQGVATFKITIRITDSSEVPLKAGLTADIDIITASKREVLLVPAEAVKDKDGKQVVTVIDEKGKTKEVEVITGLTDYDNTEIVSGLKEGDEVVVITGTEE